MKEELATAIRACLRDILDCNPTSFTNVSLGRNNRVYLATCDTTRRFAVKTYFDADSDRADRLEVEYASLVFMCKHGIDCIPCPIAVNRELRFAVYEFVDGEPISSADVSESDVEQLARFLIALKHLGNHEEALLLGNASEACFSVQAILDNLGLRLERLKSLPDDEREYRQLHRFLNNELTGSIEQITAWCGPRLVAAELGLDTVLPAAERTLSPSDFGFHNAMRCRNGEIVFLDFEYFGWDDPAKMVSDFLLHPAKTLSGKLKRSFVNLILSAFQSAAHLPQRMAIVYPLFGLKWSLILLNEFIPRQLDRRRFAGRKAFDRSELLLKQLDKSRSMLQRVVHEYRNFPYG
jgi:hypothetical protein